MDVVGRPGGVGPRALPRRRMPIDPTPVERFLQDSAVAIRPEAPSRKDEPLRRIDAVGSLRAGAERTVQVVVRQRVETQELGAQAEVAMERRKIAREPAR